VQPVLLATLAKKAALQTSALKDPLIIKLDLRLGVFEGRIWLSDHLLWMAGWLEFGMAFHNIAAFRYYFQVS
jgi:hypothetical protein